MDATHPIFIAVAIITSSPSDSAVLTSLRELDYVYYSMLLLTSKSFTEESIYFHFFRAIVSLSDSTE
jgi:hypothetical protein